MSNEAELNSNENVRPKEQLGCNKIWSKINFFSLHFYAVSFLRRLS